MIAHGMQVWTHPISSGSSASYGIPSGRVPSTRPCIFFTTLISRVAAWVLAKVVVTT
jgi:hypothetical protein